MSTRNALGQFNIEGELVERFRHGVAWAFPNMERLGEFDKEFIYDNDGTVIAKMNEGDALSAIGEKLGHISEN